MKPLKLTADDRNWLIASIHECRQMLLGYYAIRQIDLRYPCRLTIGDAADRQEENEFNIAATRLNITHKQALLRKIEPK